jgi:predicted RND superfamily exporter protein
MRIGSMLERVVRAAVRRPLVVAGTIAVVALGGGLLAMLTLAPSAGTDTLVGRHSATFKATDEYHRRFGDDAVLILVRGPLQNILGTSDLDRLIGLEGCISGNRPVSVPIPGGDHSPCAAFARSKPVQVVYGPGTFINESARQIQDQFKAEEQATAVQKQRAETAARGLAKAKRLSVAEQNSVAKQASDLVQAQFTRTILQLALRYGIRQVPSINDPDFVFTLVFDARRGANVPKERFAYLFPNSHSALVQVRLRPSLSEAQRTKAIAEVRAATRMPEFKMVSAKYVVTGAPVVVSDLTAKISHAIIVLLFVALLLMAAMLGLVFRSRPRLLPLGVALAAAGIIFGGMAVFGASLTMASIAVLPVLIGLAVDYAIQLQSRFDEALSAGNEPEEAAVAAVAAGGPAIATAALATAAGFLALLISPVPMVRSFGLLLVAGIAVAFACAVSAGFAVLVASRRRRSGTGALSAALRGATEILEGAGAALARTRARGPLWWTALVALAVAGLVVAGVLVTPAMLIIAALALFALAPVATFLGARWSSALRTSAARPGRVLAIGAAVAVVGFAADTQTRVVSDITKLVPPNLPALSDLTALQKATGVSGEIDVTVKGSDLADPRVIDWMTNYQKELAARYHYSADRGCGEAKLCPALSLPDLFSTSTGQLTRARINALLNAVPAYFSQAVITPDRQLATMAFGIKLMPLDEQKAVIDDMRSRLDPPPGVKAQLAGLPVLAAEANAAVASDWRRIATLLTSLLFVALVLLAVFRRAERALVPLIPIALATGWSALVLFAIRIPLNPMSVTLGALVVAIATEFSVLLSERYRQERIAGHGTQEALTRTYESTGAAVLASGATAIAGFAALAFSDIRMLRDFGLVTVVDLSVALAGVLLVLPAVLVLAERGELSAAPGRVLARLRSVRPPRRRRAPAA